MRTRRSWLAIAVVALSWGAIVATSPARWTVREQTSVAAFELESGQTQSFQVTIRPSLAASTNGYASVRLEATASSQVVGSLRPATVVVQIDSPQSASHAIATRSGAQISDSVQCTAASCSRSYTVRALWPDGPPNARARVSIALSVEARGNGTAAPPGASVAVDVAPAP